MNKPTRILIVEDLSADVDLATRTIRKALPDCEFQVVETRNDYLNSLEVFQPDLILSDYSLPHFDGMKALQLALTHAPLTPLIIWTGSISEDVAVACMKAGAHNYVIKENLKRLGPAILHALEERELMMARRQAEEQYRAIFENSVQGIFQSTREGRYIHVNAAMARIYGYDSPEDMVVAVNNIADQIYVDPARRAEFVELLHSQGTVENFEQRNYRKDGSVIWTSTSARLVREPGGNHLYYEGFVSDISPRKQAEEKLHERERQLGILFSNLPGPVYRCRNDADYTMEFVSDGIAELSGYQAEDFRQHRRHFGKMIHPADQARVGQEIQAAVEKNQPFELTYRIITASGQEKWVWEKGQGIRAADGRLQALEGFITDVTKRRQAEEALRESENRLILALAGAQMSVWEWNLQTNQILWSREIFEITGVKENDLGGKFESFTHLIHKDDIAQVMAAAQKAMNEGTLFAEEFRIIRPDGEVRWLSNLGHAEYDTSGDHLRLIGTVQDITQRKQAQIERQVLLEITQGFTSTKDLQELLRLIHHSIAKVIHAENFAVILHRPGSGLFEQIYLVDQYDPAQPPSRMENSITSHVFHSDEPFLLNQARFEEVAARHDLKLIGTRATSWLGVPLKTSDQTIGVMVVQDYETDNRYSEHDRDFMVSIAAQVALAIERKQAEDAVREREERYRAIFEGVQDAIFVESTDGRILMVNERACEMFGYSRLEFITKTVTDLVPKGYPILTPNEIDSIPTAEPRETLNQRANGEIFPIEISGRLQVIDGETVLLVVVRDITERKRSEKLLQESEERFSSAFEYASIGMALVTPQGQWLRVNRALCNLTGYSAAELTSKTFQEITHPADLESDLDHVRQMLAGEINSYQMEKRYFHKSGHVVWVLLSVSLVRDHEGEPLHFISQIQDITERKKAETALLESITRFRRLFEASPDAILLLDPSDGWSIIDCNTSACQMNGYSREELIGQCVDILSAVPNSQEDRTAYLEKIRQHGILRYETAHRRKDGSIITVEVSTSVIQFGERDIVLGIDRDITRRKLSELEIRRHVAELEALYENGLAVGRLLKPGEIGNRVIETFARYLSWHHVAIRLRRDDSDDLDLVAFSLPDLKEADRARIEQHFMASLHKVGQGLSGWVMQTGKPFRTGEVHSQSQYVETLAGIHSGLYMPLKVGERVIGVISVESEAPDAFTEEDERLLATLANQAAIAFENARLYATIQNELAERKRAEEALRASESHYRELADSITDILFETDEDLRYTHWNKASESFSGIPAQDAIGKSMRELFGTSQEQSKREEIYKSILKEQRARTFETQVVAKGQKRALEINAYPSLRGVSVVAKDVTERKRAEIIMQKRFELMEYAASHTLSELMQRTVDEVSELTGSAIGFFRFVEADSTSPALQTWSAETLWSFSATIEQEPPPALDQAGTWAEAARQRRSLLQNDCETVSQVAVLRQIVIPIVRGDQIVAMMSIANKPQNYTQDDLEIAGHLADHAWDIIERKQMELALETERNQLARRVEERTADLSRANSNLARALRVKDEFLANMSHELRTPLNAILGLSESLGEQIAGPLNEKQQKYITTISESGHHLLSLINDILDLAKIEAGQITLDINKVDIRSVCQSSLRMVKQLAQKKNQEISLEIDDGLGLMWADERRLKQMIVNLLGNAVKFTPEHGKLGLEVHGDRAANKIAIMVWDHGIGIQAEDLARLFQPFVQLDSGLAREATGTGLGLALVAQMARLHGGTVSAVSEPEQGSRFTIVLPWEPALAIQTASHLRNTGKLRALPAGPSRKPTVLLVEDSGDVTMMIRDYLERAGYKIVTAGDGLECLTQARRARPDLILMDIQLPHMDGLEATRRLRSEPEFRYTPIIALTALAMPNDRERCLAAGMDEYISKPINLKALVKLIQNCLFDHEEAPPR